MDEKEKMLREARDFLNRMMELTEKEAIDFVFNNAEGLIHRISVALGECEDPCTGACN